MNPSYNNSCHPTLSKEPIPACPYVSVIMAVKNEEKYIGKCLDGFASQTYSKDKFELVIASGSTDDTNRIIAQFQKSGSLNIILLENPTTRTADGLNLALAAASGDVLAHFIGHAYPDSCYLEGLLAAMNSAGMLLTAPKVNPLSFSKSALGNAIALALTSPFSVGKNSYNRVKPAYLHYSHWPLFPRHLAQKLGKFKHYTRGEDYEYFERAATLGARVYFCPSVNCYYYCRESFQEIFKIYYIMGRYRLILFFDTGPCLRFRHLVPLLGVSVIFTFPLFHQQLFYIYLIILVSYIIINIFFAYKVSSTKKLTQVLLISCSFLTIHISNGLGMVTGLIFDGFRILTGKIFTK